MAGSLFVWVGNGRVLEVMESVMIFAQYPGSIYGRVFQLVLAVLVPAAMIAFLPAQALLGRPEPITLAAAPACAAFFLASLAFWRAMLRRYAGGGG
jgi:ABC-2 type transport system permease protein